MSKTKTSNFNLENKKVIEVKVKPNSKNSSVAFDEENNIYTFSVKSPPEDGKANEEIIKIIKKDGKINY